MGALFLRTLPPSRCFLSSLRRTRNAHLRAHGARDHMAYPRRACCYHMFEQRRMRAACVSRDVTISRLFAALLIAAYRSASGAASAHRACGIIARRWRVESNICLAFLHAYPLPHTSARRADRGITSASVTQRVKHRLASIIGIMAPDIGRKRRQRRRNSENGVSYPVNRRTRVSVSGRQQNSGHGALLARLALVCMKTAVAA